MSDETRTSPEVEVDSIPLALPEISEDDIAAVVDVLRGSQLSLGPRLGEFEQAVAGYAGSREAVAVSSGTAALHMLVHALGIGAGDEVITTPFSFIASSNCILFEGATPIFADIDPVTWDMDPAQVEEKVSERTRAMIAVHVFGRLCPVDRYLDIAQRRDIELIEDSCEALGSTLDGRMAGSFGRAGTYAFYPNKQMTTGEGGIVVTDDSALADLLRSLRNQGRGDSGWLAHPRMGWNYRIPDILCALGLSQLKRLEEFIAARENVYERYNRALSRFEEILTPPPPAAGQRISWFVYVICLREGESRHRRDAIIDALQQEGIGCRNYFAPIHLQPFYRERFGFREGDFPVTESVAQRTIALPFFNRMTDAQIDRVAGALERALLNTKGA